jgi:hypothetical protein
VYRGARLTYLIRLRDHGASGDLRSLLLLSSSCPIVSSHMLIRR